MLVETEIVGRAQLLSDMHSAPSVGAPGLLALCEEVSSHAESTGCKMMASCCMQPVP